MQDRRPWLAFFGDIPRSLAYPAKTMYEMVGDATAANPDGRAWEFMGSRSTYRRLLREIDDCTDAFASRGIGKGDTVTLSLPNCPQALILFYALNKVGAVASMIHPLSGATEIEFYLRESRSLWIVTLDAFYASAAEAAGKVGIETILVCSIADFLGPAMRLAFMLTSGRKIPKLPDDERALAWADFLATPRVKRGEGGALGPDECAVILYSGGTTGMPKGIMLSSRNFNALGMQVGTQGPIVPGDVILSILPVFHGFGLGVCVHTFLIAGGSCVLVPRFTSATVAKLVRKHRPQYMAGVPTLFESLMRDPVFAKTDLSCLKLVYAGGDKLPETIKIRFDAFLASHGSRTSLFEGYGLTESVTACIATPRGAYRPGSVGIPLPDMLAKIVAPGTSDELPPGSDGELCVSGPTLMLGYLNSPEESAAAIRRHEDGRDWLHTGDLCSMDAEGFVYFRLRMKRIIKVSGVSVTPTLVEELLDRHPDVELSCVIGVPDERKMQAVKAFVVLKDQRSATKAKERELIEYCGKHLIKWSVPESIEFRDALPLTRVGKVAYSELEREHASRKGS
ncbi:MAG TPA: AMP-binding protein [Rectinemataceae bacterium]|nr:AMP-binding protein [Rectinemataceae bacterium]